MYLNLKIHLASAKAETMGFNCHPHFCTLPLSMAQGQKFTIDEGEVFIQSINHYVAQVRLLEFSLTHRTKMTFSISEPSFFLCVSMQKGSCYLCYSPPGKYQRVIPAGTDKVLIIMFKTDWLINKSKKLTALQPFAFNNLQKPHRLPSCNIAASIFRSLKKMDSRTNDINIDADCYLFINGCINKYYNNLIARNATRDFHRHKATEIAEFVSQNFASALVDDLPGLASRFMVSERHLARLARMAFGVPLHTQVIKFRMNAALQHLFTTNKPIHEISKLTGYKESHYFSKAFKNLFGVSPKYLGNR